MAYPLLSHALVVGKDFGKSLMLCGTFINHAVNKVVMLERVKQLAG